MPLNALEDLEEEKYDQFIDVISESHIHLNLLKCQDLSKRIKECYKELVSTMANLNLRYQASGSIEQAWWLVATPPHSRHMRVGPS